MLDLIFDSVVDLLGDVFSSGAEVASEFIEGATEIDWSSVISGVINTGLLVATTITVASITEDAIRNELRNRQELKNKGVQSAVVKEFIQQSGYTEVTLAALNANNQQVGTFKMKASRSSGIEKGDKVWINA